MKLNDILLNEMQNNVVTHTLTALHPSEGGDIFYEKKPGLDEEMMNMIKYQQGGVISHNDAKQNMEEVINYVIELEDSEEVRKIAENARSEFTRAIGQGADGVFVRWSVEYDDNLSFVQGATAEQLQPK